MAHDRRSSPSAFKERVRIGEIGVAVTGNTAGLSRAFRDGERDAARFSRNVQDDVGRAENSFQGLKREISGLGAVMAGFAGGFGSGLAQGVFGAMANGVRSFVGAMIDGNAEFERYNLQFKVLLGGADQAKARLAELTEFAKVTPFELPDVVQASKILQTFGGTSLATGKNLTLFGDAASMAGAKFNELAMWIGRFYASLKGGKVDGEAIQRFRELAVVTPEFTKKLEQLTKTHGSASQAWGIFVKDLGRAKGLMEEQSRSWDGMTSNLKDEIASVARELGAPFFDAAKEGIKATFEWLNSEGGKETKAQLKDLATEAGKTLKEFGPKFIEEAGKGIVKFVKWAGSQEAKDFIAFLKDAAVKAGELYLALKVIGGLKDTLSILQLLGKLGGGGGAAAGAGATGLGGASLFPPIAIGTGIGLAVAPAFEDAMEWKRVREDQSRPRFFGSHPESSPLGGIFKQSGNLADTLRSAAGRTAEFAGAAKKAKDDMLGFRPAKVNIDPDHQRMVDEARKRTGGRDPLADVTLGDPSRRRAGGRSKRAGGPGFWDMLADAANEDIQRIKEALKAFESQLEHYRDVKTDLFRQIKQSTGASEVEMFVWERQHGTLKDLTQAQYEELLALKMEAVAKAGAARNTEIFTSSRERETASLRAYAKELGAEASVQEILAKVESSRNAISLAFWSNQARQRLDETKGRQESNTAAKEAIRNMREELGLLPKVTATAQAFIDVVYGKFRNADLAYKKQLLDLAQVKDHPAQSQVRGMYDDGGAQRYGDTLRDLALRLKLVGATSDEARLHLQLLNEGMSPEQAAQVESFQRRVEQMEQLRGIIERGAENMSQVMLDSFNQIGHGAGAMFQTLIGGFRQTLADMAAEYLKSYFRSILMNLIGGLFGAHGGAIGNPNGSGGGNQSIVTATGAARGMAPSIVVNMPVAAMDLGGFKRSAPQQQEAAMAVAMRAWRRNGA